MGVMAKVKRVQLEAARTKTQRVASALAETFGVSITVEYDSMTQIFAFMPSNMTRPDHVPCASLQYVMDVSQSQLYNTMLDSMKGII